MKTTTRETRKDTCDRCGAAGVYCDTTAGEITDFGEVVATARKDDLILMASEDGRELLCDDCAE